MVSTELVKAYCPPLLLYGLEATDPPKQVIQMMDICIDVAVKKIFKVSATGNCTSIKYFVVFEHVAELIKNRKCKFMNNLVACHYGRPISVSGRPCYILPMFFYLFIFWWPPYSPALVNGGSRKFYTWWTLSVIREVTTWIFSWSSSNYRVGQKVTKFGIFSDRTRKLSALTPECGRIL